MTPPAHTERYKHHRFPGEIISHGVWLCYRFPLRYRDVQELLFERGIDVTHEGVPVAGAQKTTICTFMVNSVEENEGLRPRYAWT